MTIDKVTVNLYKCCKCEYQWTSWNSNQGADEPLPKCCPECRSLRRNQRYLDEELVLLYRLQDQLYETNLIKESGEKIDFEGNEILRIKPYSIYPYYYDFNSYDFLLDEIQSVDIVGPIISNF